MSKSRYNEAKCDVGKIFSSPREIVAAIDLSREQKIDLLQQWGRDLHQLMVASDESMVSTRPGQAAELFRGVQSQLMSLGAAMESASLSGKPAA